MSAAEIFREVPTQGTSSKLASKTMREKVHLQTTSDVFAQPLEYKKDTYQKRLRAENNSKLSQSQHLNKAQENKNSHVTERAKAESESAEFRETGINPAIHGKRKLSLNNENNNKKFPKKRRKTIEKSRTVSKFLLGGNINDPLNLNSLADEEVSKIVNALTPISSPLPERNKDPDPVIVPQDLRDPLKLNSDTDESNPSLTKIVVVRKRKRRNSYRNTKTEDVSHDDEAQLVLSKNPLKIDVRPIQMKQPIVDKIVSPVIPEACRKRKHKRKSDPSPAVSKVLITDVSEKSLDDDITLPKFRVKGKQYQYGNYVGYYGYRNPDQQDVRLTYFRRRWFEGKTCLDIGCNTGHVTLYIAKTFQPTKIVGMDIDGKLINLARKNMRQCLEDHLRSKHGMGSGKFPVSMKKCYGELPLPSTVSSGHSGEKNVKDIFPGNVLFRCGNYVFSKDSLLQTQREEYDTVVSLSITKWIHLNWGDDGLKRFFRRIFLALKPGGVFILEPQAWPSYVKKKKMTETTYRNFYQIKFKPDQFKRFLLQDVGFSSCEVIGTPANQSKGFRRLLLLFTKLTSKTAEELLRNTKKSVSGPIKSDCGSSSSRYPLDSNLTTDATDRVKSKVQHFGHQQAEKEIKRSEESGSALSHGSLSDRRDLAGTEKRKHEDSECKEHEKIAKLSCVEMTDTSHKQVEQDDKPSRESGSKHTLTDSSVIERREMVDTDNEGHEDDECSANKMKVESSKQK